MLTGLLLLLAAKGASAETILGKGDRFLKEGREKAAVAIYQAWLAQHPRDLHAELKLAEVAIRRFDYPEARRILEKAQAEHPDSALAAAWLGRLFQFWGQSYAEGFLHETGRPDRNYPALANEYFRQAETLNNQPVRPDPVILSYLAEWRLERNDMVSAEADLNRAIEINPACIEALQGLTRFYARARDIPRAKDAILHAIELDPLNSGSYFLTAQLLATVNRPAEAVKYAEKSESLDFGRMPERDAFLAAQYDKLGENEKALTYYERVSALKPKAPAVWMKLGDLYGALNRPSDSLRAYQKALALQPDILDKLYESARADARAEKVAPALSQWRKLYAIQSRNLDSSREAVGMIAGLNYLSWFLDSSRSHAATGPEISDGNNELNANTAPDTGKKKKSRTSPVPESQEPEPLSQDSPPLRTPVNPQDERLLDVLTEQYPDDGQFRLDQVKLRIALDNGLTDATRATLKDLCRNADLGIAGEAAFLLGDDTQASDILESVDGLSAQSYARLADRLLLDQELLFSSAFYQRSRQLAPNSGVEAALRRIQAKRALADQKVRLGDLAFNRKDYAEAAAHYEEATQIYRQWDNAHLRLADAYEHLKRWPEAKNAYDKAISLSPGLSHSPGFSKHYKKLGRKVR